MKEKTKIFESDYLSYELMSSKNKEFVLNEFVHIEELIKNESEWESYPEWLEYLSKRPVGNKSVKTNINEKTFCDFLLYEKLSKIEVIEIIADEKGIYVNEIRASKIYRNSNFVIVFSSENNSIKKLCVIPISNDDNLFESELATLATSFLDKFDLIIVDWNDRKIY